MFAIFIKEINSFFGSLIAYIVIGVFLTANGLVLWGLKQTSIFDYGYATLENLFLFAPWVFMFLVPAITMRSFSEERKTGNYEMIITKPVGSFQIILAKFFANVVLVLFSLLPTLLYFFTVYQLANPVGNVDIGGIMGAYIGLFLLGAMYVTVGIFSSMLSDNQIISFIISVVICLFFYWIIDGFRERILISPIDPFLEFLSLKTHYVSISRGIIDTRDISYFLSFILIFLFLTKLIMEKRKW